MRVQSLNIPQISAASQIPHIRHTTPPRKPHASSQILNVATNKTSRIFHCYHSRTNLCTCNTTVKKNNDSGNGVTKQPLKP